MEHTDEILNEIQELACKSCGEYLLDCSILVLDLKAFGPFVLISRHPPRLLFSLLRSSFFAQDLCTLGQTGNKKMKAIAQRCWLV